MKPRKESIALRNRCDTINLAENSKLAGVRYFHYSPHTFLFYFIYFKLGNGDFPFSGDGSVGSPFTNCAKVMPTGNPSYMGWLYDLQGYTYTFVIDQVSLLLAVSVNLGVLDSSSL